MGSRTLAAVFSTRDNNFNLLRMLAATGVLVSHAYPLSLGSDAVEPLSRMLDGIKLGDVCVLVFFSISGFFITKSYYFSSSWQRFLMARVLRLFPALFVMLVVTILVGGAFLTQAGPATYWSAVPAQLAQTMTLYSVDYELPGIFQNNPYGMGINGSLWTLFYEVVCYVGVFAAGFLGILHRPRWFASLFGVTVLLCLLMPYLPVPERLVILAWLGLPFAIGAGFFIWRAVVPVSLAAALGLAAIAWTCRGTEAFGPAFVLALCYGVFVLGYWPSPFLRRYNRLGDYSYGTYIYAFPVQQVTASAGVTDPSVNIAVALPITLICAVLSWHLVEQVALKLKSAPAGDRDRDRAREGQRHMTRMEADRESENTW